MVDIVEAKDTHAFYAHLVGLNTLLFESGNEEVDTEITLSYVLEAILENKDLWIREYTVNHKRPGYLSGAAPIGEIHRLINRLIDGRDKINILEMAPFLIDTLLRLPTSFEVSEAILVSISSQGVSLNGLWWSGAYVDKDIEAHYQQLVDGRLPVINSLRNMVDGKEYYDCDDILIVYTQALLNHASRFPNEFREKAQRATTTTYIAEHLVRSSHVTAHTLDRFYHALEEVGIEDHLLADREQTKITEPSLHMLKDLDKILSTTRKSAGLRKGNSSLYKHPELKQAPAKGDEGFYARRFVDKLWIQITHLYPKIEIEDSDQAWQLFMRPLCERFSESNNRSGEACKALIYRGLMKLHEEGVCLYTPGEDRRSLYEKVKEYLYPDQEIIDEICNQVESEVFLMKNKALPDGEDDSEHYKASSSFTI